VYSGAGFEPGRRNDHGIDERPLDAVEDGRLVAFVDDADGHQHHARTHVQPPRQQEVDVRLFQFQLARLLQSFDEGVLEFQLADETNAFAELMAEEQDEPMEVDYGRAALGPVDVHFHVAGERAGARAAVGGLLRPGRAGRKRRQRRKHQSKHRFTHNQKLDFDE
jgi:hypothetical protein